MFEDFNLRYKYEDARKKCQNMCLGYICYCFLQSWSAVSPIQGGPLCDYLLIRGGGGGKKGPLPKTCHTYPTKMKLGTVIPYL